MARSFTASPSRSLGNRLGAGLAGVALAAVLAGCATPYTSSPGGSTDPGATELSEVVVVCDSGIVTGPDGIETSSSVATRIPAGDPIPVGCRIG